jgi:phosphoenolpyruvate carboxylase
VKYSDETLGELAVFHAAAEAHAKFGADVDPQCIISMCKGMSDMLEVALLLKEVGLVDPSGRSAINIVPLFETIEDLQARPASWTGCCRCTITASWSTAAARCRK